MNLDTSIALFLGNIKDIYNSNISEFHKSNKIKKIAGKIFHKKRSKIQVIFLTKSERALYEVMESYDVNADRVDIKLSRTKNITIYLETIGGIQYGSYSIHDIDTDTISVGPKTKIANDWYW